MPRGWHRKQAAAGTRVSLGFRLGGLGPLPNPAPRVVLCLPQEGQDWLGPHQQDDKSPLWRDNQALIIPQ